MPATARLNSDRCIRSQSRHARIPHEHYYYVGGNIGGPIIIPGTDFNKSRKKLFFWAGYEYMNQHPAASPINYNVPTAEQRAGDFSETTIDGQPGMVGGSAHAAVDSSQRKRLAVRVCKSPTVFQPAPTR